MASIPPLSCEKARPSGIHVGQRSTPSPTSGVTRVHAIPSPSDSSVDSAVDDASWQGPAAPPEHAQVAAASPVITESTRRVLDTISQIRAQLIPHSQLPIQISLQLAEYEDFRAYCTLILATSATSTSPSVSAPASASQTQSRPVGSDSNAQRSIAAWYEDKLRCSYDASSALLTLGMPGGLHEVLSRSLEQALLDELRRAQRLFCTEGTPGQSKLSLLSTGSERVPFDDGSQREPDFSFTLSWGSEGGEAVHGQGSQAIPDEHSSIVIGEVAHSQSPRSISDVATQWFSKSDVQCVVIMKAEYLKDGKDANPDTAGRLERFKDGEGPAVTGSERRDGRGQQAVTETRLRLWIAHRAQNNADEIIILPPRKSRMPRDRILSIPLQAMLRTQLPPRLPNDDDDKGEAPLLRISHNTILDAVMKWSAEMRRRAEASLPDRALKRSLVIGEGSSEDEEIEDGREERKKSKMTMMQVQGEVDRRARAQGERRVSQRIVEKNDAGL